MGRKLVNRVYCYSFSFMFSMDLMSHISIRLIKTELILVKDIFNVITLQN